MLELQWCSNRLYRYSILSPLYCGTEIYHMIQGECKQNGCLLLLRKCRAPSPFKNMLNDHLVIKTWQLATTYLIHENVSY